MIMDKKEFEKQIIAIKRMNHNKSAIVGILKLLIDLFNSIGDLEERQKIVSDLLVEWGYAD